MKYQLRPKWYIVKYVPLSVSNFFLVRLKLEKRIEDYYIDGEHYDQLGTKVIGIFNQSVIV